MTQDEGRDGLHVVFAERLVPPWWLWLAGIGMTAALGVAYGYALGGSAGLVVGTVASAFLLAGLVLTSPLVRVDERVFRAGRARLPLAHVGRVVALDAATSREARTVELDSRAYVLLRPLSARRVVIVEVIDERDPHPYWLVSTRRPEELERLLREAVGRPSVGRPSV